MKMNDSLLENSSNPSVVAVSGHRPFPLRTLMICFTTWLVATEVLIFDQIRFEANARLLAQTAPAFRGPEVIVPSERPSNLPSGGPKMERL
jgi:hypothetical protein